MALVWTEDNAWEAREDGWDIFHDYGSAADSTHPGYENTVHIEHIMEPQEWGIEIDEPIFYGSHQAWTHIMNLAMKQSPLHIRALQYVREMNPREYKLMRHTVKPYA